MKDGLLMVLGRLLFITLVAMGAADVTTVYKFHPIRSGLESPRYLNTCTVSVHVPDEYLGLPLVNMKDNSVHFKTIENIETIPPLYNGTYNTGWQMLASNGKLLPVPSLPSGGLSYYPDTLEISKIIKDNLSLPENQIRHHNVTGMHNRNTFLEVKFHFFEGEWRDITVQSRLDFSFIGCNRDITVKFDSKDNTFSYDIIHSFQNKEKAWSDELFLGEMIQDKVLLSYIGVHPGEVIIFYKNNLRVYKLTDSGGCRNLVEIDTRHGHGFIVEFNLPSDSGTLVSPWLDIKRNTTLLILYYRVNVNQTLSVYLEEQFTKDVIQLETQDLDQVDDMKKHDPDDVDQIILKKAVLKVSVRNPQHWTGQKRIQIEILEPFMHIGNVWEVPVEPVIKMFDRKSCAKSDIVDIYSVLPEKVRNVGQLLSCYNGGRLLDNSVCLCPPGFAGNQCETPCGRNLFGQECSNVCSRSPSECRGMILCTPSYGCACAPGYQGDQCLDKCDEGFYGANCKQNCSQLCASGCDLYTGVCQGKCKLHYATGPSCNQFHSYLREPPQVLDSGYTSIKLNINLSANNTIRFNDNTMFYMLQYREDTSVTWNNGSYEMFNPSVFSISVDGLKPGHIYYVRVLLIDETLEVHDPDIAKVSKCYTKCTNIALGNELNATRISNTSISLIWKEVEGENQCPCSSYMLQVEATVNGNLETFQIVDLKKNSYEMENLAPSQTYHIMLKKLTVYGESNPVASVNVTTDDSIDVSLEIPGVRMTKTDTQVELKWFPSPLYKTFYVKYKLRRHMCCGNEKIDSPLKIVVSNHNSYNISYDNLEPYAEYHVFVTADKNQDLKLNNFSFITKSKLPGASPILIKHKEIITNESAEFYWMNFLQSCEQMNGFFKKYLIEFYDIHTVKPIQYETTANHLLLTDLLPQSQYFVKIRYVNHVGYNPSIYTEYNFTTKSPAALIVQELVAYKTSSTLLGLRWKWSDTNSRITGLNIKLDTEIWNKTLSVTSDLNVFQCRAWPSYICFDVADLKPNIRYSITVDTLSEESPLGTGSSKPIHAITKESISLPVSDIKIEQISGTNMTVSWRIPFLLNGILRKFVLQVEHQSSSDDGLCCKSMLVIDHDVTREQERYSQVLTDILSASSYRITISPFTKRPGPPEHKIVDTPPL